MLAAPGRAATARLAPVKLQNQRSREIRRTEEGLFFENRMPQMRNSACASFFEVARQSHPPLQFYFRFVSSDHKTVDRSEERIYHRTVTASFLRVSPEGFTPTYSCPFVRSP